MSKPVPTADDFLRIGERIRVLPIVHGSGDCAIRVREELLERPYDSVAVPLPPSFQDDVEAAVQQLPATSPPPPPPPPRPTSRPPSSSSRPSPPSSSATPTAATASATSPSTPARASS